MTSQSPRFRTRGAVLRSTLESERDRLVFSARETRRAVRDEFCVHAGSAVDLAEQSDAHVRVDVEFALLALHSEMVRELADALERIDDGTYGRCGDCGGRISVQRLRALPSATRCLACEEGHETTMRREHQATARRLAHELGSLHP
jgi:DnaK suppressor protein